MFESDPLLGKALAFYHFDRLRMLIYAGAVIGVVGLTMSFTLGSREEWWGPVLSMLIVAGLTLVIGWSLLHLWNREVVLYEHGFTYREGNIDVPFRYAEIRFMRQRGEQRRYFGGLVRRAVYTVVLKTFGGDTITLTDLYRRIDELSVRLEQKVNVVLKPYVEQQLSAGESVPFADGLSLRAEGPVLNETPRTWSEVGSYSVGGRQLALLDKSGAPLFQVPLAELDNARLLLELLRERGVQPQAKG